MRRLAARDRPSGDVRDGPARPRARPVEEDARPRARGVRRRRADPPAGRGPPARPAARAADVPPAPRPPELRRDRRAAARREGRGACATPRCGGRSSPEAPVADPRMSFIGLGLDRIFRLGEPPDYEPRPEESIAAIARVADGVDPSEVLYDLLLEQDGRELLLRPLLGYANFTQDPIREMVLHPATALGLGDGGAHVGAICDASIETYMLTHWVRDRTRGERLPARARRPQDDERHGVAVRPRRPRHVAAGHEGRRQRHRPRPSQLHRPEMVYDLPGGARRLLQRADGYTATIVSGEVVMRDGEPTPARRPGACSAAHARHSVRKHQVTARRKKRSPDVEGVTSSRGSKPRTARATSSSPRSARCSPRWPRSRARSSTCCTGRRPTRTSSTSPRSTRTRPRSTRTWAATTSSPSAGRSATSSTAPTSSSSTPVLAAKGLDSARPGRGQGCRTRSARAWCRRGRGTAARGAAGCPGPSRGPRRRDRRDARATAARRSRGRCRR